MIGKKAVTRTSKKKIVNSPEKTLMCPFRNSKWYSEKDVRRWPSNHFIAVYEVIDKKYCRYKFGFQSKLIFV